MYSYYFRRTLFAFRQIKTVVVTVRSIFQKEDRELRDETVLSALCRHFVLFLPYLNLRSKQPDADVVYFNFRRLQRTLWYIT